jgi:hypothetical protein
MIDGYFTDFQLGGNIGDQRIGPVIDFVAINQTIVIRIRIVWIRAVGMDFIRIEQAISIGIDNRCGCLGAGRLGVERLTCCVKSPNTVAIGRFRG